MRMGSSWKNDKHRRGVRFSAFHVATEPSATFGLSNMKCVVNKAEARDSWTICNKGYVQGHTHCQIGIGSLFDDFADRSGTECAGQGMEARI
jgi:hypothetical protein